MGYYTDQNFIRVNHNGQFAGRIPKHRWAWMNTLHGWYRGRFIPLLKTAFKWSVVVSTAVGISYAWAMTNIEPKIEYVREKESQAIVLEKIARCESAGKQFEDDGRLVKRVNKNGSVDYGKFQINDKHWELKAIELGYNIYTLEGNEAMAKWIYENRGTEDWYLSKKCWQK